MATKKTVKTKKTAAKKAPAKGGRPSLLEQIDLVMLTKLAEQGLTDKQLAYVFGITEQSINRYKKDQGFCKALKKGKKISDSRVVRSLFERAIGYEHPDVDIRAVKGEIVQTQIIKHYPPDPTAAIFWLKNRDPEIGGTNMNGPERTAARWW